MKPIAIFYHGLVTHGEPRTLRTSAVGIVMESFRLMQESGLYDAANQIICGFNEAKKELPFVRMLVGEKPKIVLHGLQSFAENLTIIELEKWIKENSAGSHVLYLHAKGATHNEDTKYYQFAGRWRRCMLSHLVTNWKQCIADLDSGLDAVGCHWMTGLGSDKSQNIFAGNFWWATSEFLTTVPTMFLRDRIKVSGIADKESRYESEVWLGNAPALPKVKDYHPGGIGTC